GLADVTLHITYLPKKHWGAIYQILKKIANWYYNTSGTKPATAKITTEKLICNCQSIVCLLIHLIFHNNLVQEDPF
ncbi:MAG: hypothetical protein ACLPVO_06390, partial [Desulfomonilaceae bacterium]